LSGTTGGAVVVDYLQLMGTPDRRSRDLNRTQEVGQISKALKGLAKELHVPVIALAQLSRATETRHDKKPQLSDLRGSGQIEQDADVVTLLHRPEAYPGHKAETEGLAHVYIAKNRIGPTGKVTLGFDGSRFRFRSRINYPSAE